MAIKNGLFLFEPRLKAHKAETGLIPGDGTQKIEEDESPMRTVEE